MKRTYAWLAAIALLAVVGGSTASAAFDTTGATFQFTSTSQIGQLYVDIDFGGTAHSETLSIEMTTTETGYYEACMCTPSAQATNMTEWNAANPWDYAASAVTAQTYPYATASLSGVQRLVFYVQILAAPTAATADVTIRVHNGAQTATAPGGWVNNLMGISSFGGSPATSGSTYVLDGYCECWGVLRAADTVQFEFEVDLGSSGSVPISMRVWTIPTGSGQTTGSGTIDYDLHELTTTGGYGTPNLSLTADTATTNEDCTTYTSTLTGTQTFRVVMTPQSGMTPNVHCHAQITFGTGVTTNSTTVPTPGQAPATPLTITPGTSTITASTALTASGGSGTPSYTWSEEGTWPAGVSLSSTTGTTSTITITTAPTPGTQVTVRLTNGQEWVEEVYTINGGGGGGGTLTITTTSLPNGVESVAYGTANIVATSSGTTGPTYTWSVSSGTLPPGLTLGGSTSLTETLSGTPSAGSAGTYPFDLTISDGTASDSQSYSVDISAAGVLTITTTSLADATEGTAYSANIVAAGGTGTHTWSITAGSLPSGLSLGASTTGTVSITGTPAAGSAGPYSFTVQVVDSTSPTAQTDTQAFTLTVNTGGGGGGPGGLSGGGGGGGGGCVATSGNTAWMLMLGLLAMFGLALRMRSRRA